jgi:hypothetical protein
MSAPPPSAVRERAGAPRISVVTPSYNLARFLDACLHSVVSQGYPNLEYIVVDGGSTDGSVDIIKRYGEQLAYAVSEPDGGQYDALNKGFQRATGDILAWLNADDMYLPWTLSIVAEVFTAFPEVEWISSLYPLLWNRRGVPGDCRVRTAFGPGDMLAIQQESTFWRRRLWERVGGRLDTSLSLAADLELWARFWQVAPLHGVTVPLAGMRVHADQRSVRHQREIVAEAHAVLDRYRRRPPSRLVRAAQEAHRALPPPARRILARLGLPYRWGGYAARNIRQRDERWCIDEVHVW